jgi:hypothetical protein
MRSVLIVTFFLSFSLVGYGNSDQSVYKFLTLPNSSAVSALGGSNVSLQNRNLNMIFQNPALLSGEVHQHISLSYVKYIEKIGIGTLAYGQNIDEKSHWAVGISYLNYGSFDGYTEDEIPTGTFSAGDLVINAVYARKLSKYIMGGVTLKPIYSYIENYNSFGLAVDVGANYYHPEHDLSIGLVLKNVGVQFNGYYSIEGDQHREPLPWDIQLGITKRLAHAPFRFSLTFVNLNKWDLSYHEEVSPSVNNVFDQEKKGISWGDMLLRHMVFGVEFIPSKNFNIAIGYNHRRSKEFSLENTRAMNGFSFGVGFKVYKFNLGASYAQYAASGNTFTISLATSLDSFR